MGGRGTNQCGNIAMGVNDIRRDAPFAMSGTMAALKVGHVTAVTRATVS